MLMVSSRWYYHFRCVWPGMAKLPKIKGLLFLCNMLRKKWVKQLIFCMQISMKACYKLILKFFDGDGQAFPKLPSLQCLYNILKKKLEMNLNFWMQINIKVSWKLISTLWTSKFPTRDTIITDGHDQVFSKYSKQQVCNTFTIS